MGDQHMSVPRPEQYWTGDQGARLAEIRRSRGILQAQLAEDVDVPRSVLSNWENAARRPNQRQIEQLAAVLNVAFEDLLGPTTPQNAPPPAVPPRAVELTSGFVVRDELPQVQRFVDQVLVFERMSEREDLPLRRWRTARRLAEQHRADLLGLDGQNERTRLGSRVIGRQFGRALRAQLDLGDAPLPGVEATAELCGVHVFRAPFNPTEAGRLRGLLVESEQLGGVALVNSYMTDAAQRIVVVEAVAKALLQPAGATAVVASGPRSDRTNLDTAAAAFTRELAIPQAMLELEVNPLLASAERSDTSAGAEPDPLGDRLVETVVERTLLYGVPIGYVLAGSARLPTDYLQRIATTLNVARTRSRAGGRRAGHPSWDIGADDLPQRFLHRLLESLLAGRASMGGVSELTGLGEGEIDQLIAAATAVDRTPDATAEVEDLEWLDRWHPDVA